MQTKKMKGDLMQLVKSVPESAYISFVSVDPDVDTLLSMHRSQFIPALSKLDLSTTTEVFNPISVLYNLVKDYRGFQTYCGPDDSSYEHATSSRKGMTFF